MAWAGALEDIERQLDELEASLEAGASVERVVGAVPRGLGDLPAELQERAALLHRRMLELEQILQLELEHTRQMLVLGGTANDGPSRPVMFDQRG